VKRNKLPRKLAKPAVRAQSGTKSKSRFQRVISLIKSPVGKIISILLLPVSLVSLAASLVEIANLFRDYGVEPEIVASEIDPRDPFHIPFTIKNDSSWWGLYDVQRNCMFDMTTDWWEITNGYAVGDLPGLNIKSDIAPRGQMAFRCSIRIPERRYRLLRVGVFVTYEVRPFPLFPLRKHETYAEFNAIWDSTGRPRWVTGPVLGLTAKPFERKAPPLGREAGEWGMTFRSLHGYIPEGEEPWFSGGRR
jgi:hypothetical protein